MYSHARHRSSWFASLFMLLALAGLTLAGCGTTSAGNNGNNGNSSTPSATKTNVSIAFGYIPDIQFAPFYVAQSKGYYSAAGLNVTFHSGFVNDLIGSVAVGHDTFVFATGDEELVARSKNINVVDVATIYQRYPVSLIVPANSSIHTLADIKGHSIGEPGPFGATYVGLLALLNSVHLTTSDVHLQSIGFTQVTALLAHRFDAVVGYSNNEPLQLAKQGLAVRTFNVSDYQPLVSNGLITTANTLHTQPQMVKAFVSATLKGLQEVIANPTEAVQISQSYVPGMNVASATAVLQATIPIWQGSAQTRLGFNDSATWQSMTQFLVSQKIIPPVSDVTQAYTNSALP
jgi:NitT/TauT family transport system substrate-binding protein